MTNPNQTHYEIRLMFIDDKMGGITTIGGAAWLTRTEQCQRWREIPCLAKGDTSDFVADFMDKDQYTILKTKPVSAEICERLMGLSIADLIERGRKITCYTLADIPIKAPHLIEQFPRLFERAA